MRIPFVSRQLTTPGFRHSLHAHRKPRVPDLVDLLGRLGVRRPGRVRRPVAGGLAGVLVVSLLAAIYVFGSRAAAADPPPLVGSTPNFGWTQGEFSVSGDGAAQYSLPLWVPPGRGLATPKLALAYNSRGGNGLQGVGWSVSGLSSITWCPRTHAQDGYSNAGNLGGLDPLCLDGNRLLPQANGLPAQQTYKTERETFARITGYGADDAVPDYFRVEAKDGLILTYGQTGDSRLAGLRLKPKPDPERPAYPDFEEPGLVAESQTRFTVGWAVNKIEDRNGNAATVEYLWNSADPNNTVMTPSVIRYAPNRQVRFVYETTPRQDPIDAYGAGVHMRSDRRLSRIEMWGGPLNGAPAKLREYQLGYRYSLQTRRSLLTDIKECDPDANCKQALPLNYSPGGDIWQRMTETALADRMDLYVNWVLTGDVNGDGRGDLVYQSRDADTTWVQLGTGTGSGFADPVESPGVGDITQQGLPKRALRPVMVDADGRTDLMADDEFVNAGNNGHRWQLFEFDGSRFLKGPGGDVGTFYDADDDVHQPVYLGDLDGNGLPDFVPVETDPQFDHKYWSYRLNTGGAGGDRFGPWHSLLAPPVEEGSIPAVPARAQVADVNGDGRAEIVQQRWRDVREGYTTWGLDATGGLETGVANIVNTGNGMPSNDLLQREASFGDLNGDGLDDAVVVERSFSGSPDRRITTWTLRAQVNSGRGFASPVQPNPPTWTYSFWGDPQDGGAMGKMVVADFNGDGRDDVLAEPFEFVEGQLCTSRAELYEWRDDRFEVAWIINNTKCGALPLDIDADGILDLVVGDGVRGIQVNRHLGGVADRLTGIGIGNGQQIEIEYTTLADRDVHTPCTGAVYPLMCRATGGSIVRMHRVATTAPGTGAWDTFNHTYKHARADLQGRGWLGFAEHRVTRGLNGAITVTEFDNVTRDSSLKVYYRAHLPKKITMVTDPLSQGGEYRTTTVNDNEIRRIGTKSYTVELKTVTQTEQERPIGGTALQTLRTRTTTTTYDAYGNPDLVVSTTTGGRKVTDDPTFTNNTTAWLIGQRSRQVTTGCDTANRCVTRTSRFEYHPNGNLRLNIVEPDQPTFRLTTETFYDTVGNVTSQTRTDAAGQVRTGGLEYNADKLYPTATVNALGHRTVIETHPGLGLQTKVTDANGVWMRMRYDKFGRLRETNRADGSFEHITHDLPSNVTQRATTTVSGGGVTTVVVDRLGRAIQQTVKAFDGRIATTHTTYDAFGRVEKVSRPMFAGETRRDTLHQYDFLDRPIRTTAPDGVVVTREYKGLETHTVDAKGVRSLTVSNKDGEVASSSEDDPNATAGLATTFEYGPFGQANKITAPDGTAQTMRYDVLGRQDQLVDPSSGTTTMTYTAFGEVHTKSDGSGSTTTFEYDVLGRVTKERSPDGAATNTWDSAENGIGKLHSADSPDSVFTRYSYDEFGHQKIAARRIGGETFEVITTYDEIGRPKVVTYPHVFFPGGYQRLRVEYAYNANGYLAEVRDPAAPPEALPYWKAQARNAAGQITKETQGNGVVTDHTYQPTTGLMDTVTTTGPGAVGKLGEISYGYDPNRNVTLRHDKVNQRHEKYTHDELNRLKQWQARPSATGNPVLTSDYRYDKVGNLTTETTTRPGQPVETVGYEYGYQHPELTEPPHALVARNGARYTYDGAGRQVGGPNRTVTYTTRNLPKTFDNDSGRHEQFQYDATGARALKHDDANDVTVITAGDMFERRSPAGHASSEIHNLHNILADGRIVAQINLVQPAGGGAITNSRVLYLHADTQGSTTLVTNANGVPYQGDESIFGNLFYDPWGRRVDQAYGQVPNNRIGGPRQLYTGQYHDDEIYLINMKGRMFDPHARRFLTPDPILSDPQRSQSLNRYTYVRNNPTTLTDPTGLCPECGADTSFDDFTTWATNIFSAETAGQPRQSTANGCACVADTGAEPSDEDSGYNQSTPSGIDQRLAAGDVTRTGKPKTRVNRPVHNKDPTSPTVAVLTGHGVTSQRFGFARTNVIEIRYTGSQPWFVHFLQFVWIEATIAKGGGQQVLKDTVDTTSGPVMLTTDRNSPNRIVDAVQNPYYDREALAVQTRRTTAIFDAPGGTSGNIWAAAVQREHGGGDVTLVQHFDTYLVGDNDAGPGQRAFYHVRWSATSVYNEMGLAGPVTYGVQVAGPVQQLPTGLGNLVARTFPDSIVY